MSYEERLRREREKNDREKAERASEVTRAISTLLSHWDGSVADHLRSFHTASDLGNVWAFSAERGTTDDIACAPRIEEEGDPEFFSVRTASALRALRAAIDEALQPPSEGVGRP